MKGDGFCVGMVFVQLPLSLPNSLKNENCSFFAKEVRKFQKVAESDKVRVVAEFAQLSLYSLTGSEKTERPVFRNNSQNFPKGYRARQSLQTRSLIKYHDAKRSKP